VKRLSCSRLSEKQKAVWADLDALSKKHGPEVFRILGQRYFKFQRDNAAMRDEIAAREKELRELQSKATRRA
jgi:hypothetical protein